VPLVYTSAGDALPGQPFRQRYVAKQTLHSMTAYHNYTKLTRSDSNQFMLPTVDLYTASKYWTVDCEFDSAAQAAVT
jgi:hypothetical protein